MKYYYVMAQKGKLIYRYYVRLDSESADILHDALEARYDLCQVCDWPGVGVPQIQIFYTAIFSSGLIVI